MPKSVKLVFPSVMKIEHASGLLKRNYSEPNSLTKNIARVLVLIINTPFPVPSLISSWWMLYIHTCARACEIIFNIVPSPAVNIDSDVCASVTAFANHVVHVYRHVLKSSAEMSSLDGIWERELNSKTVISTIPLFFLVAGTDRLRNVSSSETCIIDDIVASRFLPIEISMFGQVWSRFGNISTGRPRSTGKFEVRKFGGEDIG